MSSCIDLWLWVLIKIKTKSSQTWNVSSYLIRFAFLWSLISSSAVSQLTLLFWSNNSSVTWAIIRGLARSDSFVHCPAIMLLPRIKIVWSQLAVIHNIGQTAYTKDALAYKSQNECFCSKTLIIDQPLTRSSERCLLRARCFVLTDAWSSPPLPPPRSFGCDWNENNQIFIVDVRIVRMWPFLVVLRLTFSIKWLNFTSQEE